MKTQSRLALIEIMLAVAPRASFADYSVTDGLAPAKLKKENVKIAVIKVKATGVVRPETRKRFADGSSSYTLAIYSIDLELIEQLYGDKLTERKSADTLSDDQVSRSAKPADGTTTW